MIDRRHFLAGLAATPVLPATTVAALQQARDEASVTRQIAQAAAGPPVRLGMIGAGSRGQELVRNFTRVSGVSLVAVADVYPPRFDQVRQLLGSPVAQHDDYRALLERKDLDAVVIATPLGLHAEHAIAALASGRHVYSEKTMAYTVEQGHEIVAAVERRRRVFQVGHQYRYSPWIRAAIARALGGEIGDVTHIHGYWNRNNNWRRPVPRPGGNGSANDSLERLINWRLYHRWSLGLIAELGSHHMDLANWIFQARPTAALASGSICCYHDGRETDDNVQVVLSYPGGRRFVFTSMTDNGKQGDQLWVYGTRGSLNLTLEDATFFYEPRQVAKAPLQGNAEEKGVTTSASYRPSGEMPYRGPGKPVALVDPEDATTIATRAFIHCVRTGERPVADVEVGMGATLCVVHADQARRERREIGIARS